MKKQELFNISPEGAVLVQKYEETRMADDGLYFKPDAKRTRIMKSIDNMQNSICRVSGSNPSFDEVASLARQIAEDCLQEDTKPVYPQTKEEIYIDIIKRLQPILDRELVGKYICIKTGSSEFKYLKVTKVDAKVGFNDCLQVWVDGPGFGFSTDDNSGFPAFKKFSIGCAGLLLTGKDTFDYKKRWMYIMSKDAIKEKLDSTMAYFRNAMELD